MKFGYSENEVHSHMYAAGIASLVVDSKELEYCARQKNPPERSPSDGSGSPKHLQQIAKSDHGIGPIGQLKVAVRDTEPEALATVTLTVGRE
jgi:hypothetical protein